MNFAKVSLSLAGFAILFAVFRCSTEKREVSPQMQVLLIATADAIRNRGLYCPSATYLMKNGGSANFPQYRVTCDGSRGMQIYQMITDANSNVLEIREK